MTLRRGDIKFNINGKRIKFSVYNDLPDTFGLSLNNAFDNWIVRTDTYTAESFCEYVLSKGTGHICLTEQQYKQLNDEQPRRR